MDKENSYIGTRQRLWGLWDRFRDIILEPLLFGFVLFMLFPRMETIVNYIAENPTYPLSFWTMLKADVQLHPFLYGGFLVVFVLWVISEGMKYQKAKLENKQLNSTVEKMSTNIRDLQQVIKDLSDKIAESKNGVSGKK